MTDMFLPAVGTTIGVLVVVAACFERILERLGYYDDREDD